MKLKGDDDQHNHRREHHIRFRHHERQESHRNAEEDDPKNDSEAEIPEVQCVDGIVANFSAKC